MIRKLMVAGIALAATLAISLGCPRQESGSQSGESGSSVSGSGSSTGRQSNGALARSETTSADTATPLETSLPRQDQVPHAAADASPSAADSATQTPLVVAPLAAEIAKSPLLEPVQPAHLNPVHLPLPHASVDPTTAPPDAAVRPVGESSAVDPLPGPVASEAKSPPVNDVPAKVNGAAAAKLAADLAAPARTEGPSRTEAPAQADAPAHPEEAPHADGDPGSKANGPEQALFQDWPKPKAVIVVTGMQMGYIEPCGCSGKENQKGGLSRRHNMLKSLAAKGWPVVPIDVGGQVRRFGKQAELKFQATSDALIKMKYEAITFGADDLRLPAEALTAAAVNQQPSPYLSANVALFGFDQNLMPRFRVIQAGGLKIGVTAVIGAEMQKGINNGELEFKPAAKAIAEVMPQLKAAHCDRMILLAETNAAEAAALAKEFPEFDFIATSAGAAEPPRQPSLIPGTKTRLIEVGQKGMYANAIGLFDNTGTPVRFQKIALDAHWGESNAMKQVMASYQEQLKQLGLTALGLTPAPFPSGSKFVGSKVCGDCHTKAYDVWKKTPHATALDTLAKLDPPRNFDPECLACHVTGWEPQRYYPYRGGFSSLKKTPNLVGNGCENCHGPGGDHVAAENGDKKVDAAQLDALRASLRIPIAKAENNCTQCHDGDNSLSFDFKTYWPKVAHKGKN